MVERVIGGKVVRLIRADITELDVEAFVFDIESDMKLGAGFGSAIQRLEARTTDQTTKTKRIHRKAFFKLLILVRYG